MPLATIPRGAVLATLAALCWGAATVMSKSVLSVFPPVFLLVLQLLASVICLWVFIFLRRRPLPKPAPAEVLKFASLGLLEPGLAYLLSLIGLATTTASNATLIYSTEAIMIIVLGVLLFGEKPTLRFVIFSLIAVGGLCFALGVFSAGDGGGSIKGDALIFAGTLVAALYVVLSARFAARIDAVIIVAWQQTVALIFAALLLPASAALELPSDALTAASPGDWLLAALSGVVQYALAFSLYIAALKTISANYAGSFLNLIPLFGLAGAFLFLHETLSLPQLIGAGITVLAVSYINLRLQPATDKPAQA